MTFPRLRVAVMLGMLPASVMIVTWSVASRMGAGEALARASCLGLLRVWFTRITSRWVSSRVVGLAFKFQRRVETQRLNSRLTGDQARFVSELDAGKLSLIITTHRRKRERNVQITR